MNSENTQVSLDDTIIIFEKPDLYFFKLLSPHIYTPYSVKYATFKYYIYKALHILHIPLYKLFWRNWSHGLSSAKNVIIFDYGYQRGMEQYIRAKNPNCNISLFLWNKVDKAHHTNDYFSLKDRIFSTDITDCQKYGFKHNTMFYLNLLYRKSDYNNKLKNNEKLKLFFIGSDKNRGKYLCQLNNVFSVSGIECDIRLLTNRTDAEYLSSIKSILASTPLTYNEYLEQIRRSDIILDIVQDNQTALTMRVVESIFLNKKLITNNQSIKDLSFYNANNIYVFNAADSIPPAAEIKEFIQKPFIEYPKEVRNYYDIQGWLNRF